MNKNKLQEIADKIVNIVINKNKLYGDSYKNTRQKYGEIIILVRLEDKLKRLENLILKKMKSDESIEDTLMDIAGYVLLELYYRKKNNE